MKKNSHMFFKGTLTQINYKAFSKLRAKCKTQSKFDYNNFILTTQNSLSTYPILFWKFLFI